MSKSGGFSVSSLSRALAALSLSAVALVGGAASAQTLPQLLPYTTKVVAGTTTVSGQTPKANPAAGGACPSGLTATDAYGDGCLATEVIIGTTASNTGPRDAVADAAGNIFFGDFVNGIVHRVDALTGVMTAVAGGATTSPQAGASCAGGASTDAKGDGCLGTAVHLSKPTALVLSTTTGDLYFADFGYGNVRKITATNGSIPATGGIISLVAGSAGTTSAGYTTGYNVSNATTTVTGAQSVLDGPYGLSLDSKGDLFIADEFEAAGVVLNTSVNPNVVNSVSLAPGTIWKIAGTVASSAATYPYCVNATTSSAGCAYNVVYTAGGLANQTPLRSSYTIASAPNGNTYMANEYYDTVLQISPTGVLTNFAGVYNKTGSSTARAVAGTNAIGSPFGVAADAYSNVYFTDAAYGNIWRVDAGTNEQFLIASGLGKSQGTTPGFASATLPGPGVFGISVDVNGNLFFGDTENGTVSEIATGVQFGTVGALQPTQTLDIHFGVGDGPAAATPYVLSAATPSTGTTNFSLGTANCTTNSDNTMDCTLPVTATPRNLGAFTGLLTVNSSLGATNAFTLSGTYSQSPATRLGISFAAPSVNCTGTSTFSVATPIQVTATLVANGPSAPAGTIQFYANNAAIGTAQSVTNLGTATAPIYGATLSYTFSTPNTYTLTAVYSGDSYFKTSTSAGTNVTTSNPTFSTSAISAQENSVVAGGTALYSFNIAQSVYAGTITFSCSGLPSGAACSFSPATVTAVGCSTGTTVALSITTSQGQVTAGGVGGMGGGRWQLMAIFPAVGLALLIGLRRRKAGLRYGHIWMSVALLVGLSSLMACTSAQIAGAGATPKVSNAPITVTATGSAGTVSSFSVSLTVN